MSTATHQLDPAVAPERILATTPASVRRLTTIVGTLYAGNWDDCAEDLRRRQAGKPYLYRVDLPDIDVLTWIHRLKTYETARGEALIPASASGPVHGLAGQTASTSQQPQTAENRP